MASLVLQTINPLDQLVQYYIKIFLKLYYSVSQKMSFLWRFELTQGVTNFNEIDHLYFVSVHSLKGLEDFSANPVTLRGNILRMR